MNFNKIKENFRIIGEALVDSGKELINGLKEEVKPKTTEEKLKEAKELILSNPDLSKEEILEILDRVDEENDSVEILKRKVSSGYAKLLELYKDAPEQAKKIRDRIQKVISSGSKEELIEALKLERILEKAQDGSKAIIKRVKHILNSFVD